MGPAARVLVVSEDDDVGEPLEVLLGRAGYAVEVADGRDGARLLDGIGGRYDALILDRDLPPEQYAGLLVALAPRGGASSCPLLVLGGGPAPPVPEGWHEDASASVARPPQSAEILATLRLLLRLVFYRRYRDLVHDLAQPVTALHALSRSIARIRPEDEQARKAIERLAEEAERLMVLLETFQRSRGPAIS